MTADISIKMKAETINQKETTSSIVPNTARSSQDLGKTILPSINLDIVQKTMHKASPATKSNPFEVSTGILAKGRKKSGNNTTTKNNDKKESRSNILVFIK